jgi:hypothetical protein
VLIALSMLCKSILFTISKLAISKNYDFIEAKIAIFECELNQTMKNWALFIFLLIGVTMVSCKDDPDPLTPPEVEYNGLKFTASGTLNLPLTHVFNKTTENTPFALNTNYLTPLGDSIKVSELSYYLTNVSLLNANNVWINLGNYDLVDVTDAASMNIALSNVPVGTYSRIRFLVGVDSLANSTGVHEGELSPAFGMYWTWATGYVFFRMKGRCSANRSLTFDIGGDANLMSVEIPLNAFKKSGSSFTLNTQFNIADIFISPNNYSLNTNSIDIHTATNADVHLLSDNIVTGAFTITSVQ